MSSTLGYCLLSYYFGLYTFAYFRLYSEQKRLTDYETNDKFKYKNL